MVDLIETAFLEGQIDGLKTDLDYFFKNQLLRQAKWRRGGDSNPRCGITAHSLSRRAP
jgi:hypothetical protein